MRSITSPLRRGVIGALIEDQPIEANHGYPTGESEVKTAEDRNVVNTYRVWLRYELFRGKLTEKELEASEANLSDYIKAHSNTKTHLMEYCGPVPSA